MRKEKNSNKTSIKDVILSIFVLLVYLIFGIAAFPNKDNLNEFNVLYYFVYMLFTIVIIIYAYKKEFALEFKEFMKNIFKNLFKCFGIFILLFLIITIGNFIIDQLFGWTKLNADTLIFPNMKEMLLYTALVLVIYTPFVEGVIFTKVINNIINKKVVWVVISGVLYGLMQAGFNFSNLLNIASAVPYVLIGIIIALIYEKKKNVFYPIFIWLFYYLLQFVIQSSAYWG